MSARPAAPADRNAAVLRVLWWIMALNLVVAVAKLAYGWRSGALAISADGLHSLLDAAANLFGVIAIGVARRPADENHPYGHRKYETVAALAVAMLLLFGCWEIATTAIERLHSRHVPEVGMLGVVVLLGTLAINIVVAVVERRAGQRLQSELLVSDAAHTASDVFATMLVFVSLAATRLGWVWADIAAAGAIVLLIFAAGLRIARQTLSTLSDERQLDPAAVERTAMEEPGVLEVHNVRSRGTRDDIHLDLHVLVNPSTPIDEAHALGHRVERRLRQRFEGLTDVVVHVEPGTDRERATHRVGGGLRAEGVGGARDGVVNTAASLFLDRPARMGYERGP